MPTESDFLSAAQAFDDAGGELSGIPGLIAGSFGPDVVTGGQLTVEINSFIEQTTGGCVADAATLGRLAATCRERAEVVANYAAAMNGYGYAARNYSYQLDRWIRDDAAYDADPELHGHPGPRPRAPIRPSKPASWVEI